MPEGSKELPNSKESEGDHVLSKVAKLQIHGVKGHCRFGEDPILEILEMARLGGTCRPVSWQEGGSRLCGGPLVATLWAVTMGSEGMAGPERKRKMRNTKQLRGSERR